MRGFILAAGFGTRLRPLTNHIPKSLLPVCGIPLLERRLKFLTDNGIETIGVNSHYLHEQFETFRNNCPIGFDLFHETDSIRGSGGPLYFAKDFLQQSDIFCICNAEPLTVFDLQEKYSQFRRSSSVCTLLAAPSPGNGTVFYEPESGEYVGPRNEIQNKQGLGSADFIGVALYRKEFLELMRPDDFSILPIWKRAQENGLHVTVSIIDELYWKDIGNPGEFAEIHFDFLEGKTPLDIPRDYVFDRERKVAFPAGLARDRAQQLKEHVWCDSASLPDDVVFFRSVILQKPVNLTENGSIEKAIISFGEVVSLE
ncbi:MAG: NTP transferase domain-containing protein [Chitinivibrionales bacterium]|nr:NTP transferase domain-containing protein [Chitinivibrionales bacterium]